MHGLLQGRRLQSAPRGVPNRLQPTYPATQSRRHRRCARQHPLDHVAAISGNGSAASRNAPTATSFAAFSTAGAVPPASAALRARRQGRETLQVGRFEIQAGGAQNVERFYTGGAAAPASPARAQSAYACRDCRVAPASSRRRTRPANARCSADARRPRPARAGRPNSRQASISSRPLFMSVAESTEILRPMTQRGCAQA